MAGFNYTPLRNTAIGLVKKFANKIPCSILRTVEGTPADPNMPWRVGAGTIKEFKFLGVVSYGGFPKRGDPVTDQDVDIIAPGDLETTAAVGDPGTLCGDVLMTDRLSLAGSQYAILGVQPIRPDGATFIFKLRCKAWPLLLPQPGGI